MSNKQLPSAAAKLRLASSVERDIVDGGRIARKLCTESDTRQILLKCSKRMAGCDGRMEQTLQSLKLIEKLLQSSHSTADEICRRIDQTTVIRDQLHRLLNSP
ncbi:hypothetical protein EMCRGX_G029656 [Ephydatia muelleri]